MSSMHVGRIINVFLGSSIKELPNERENILATVPGDVKEILEKNQIIISFENCESIHEGNSGEDDQNRIDQKIQKCDYSLFLFKTHLGPRTKREFEKARELQKQQKEKKHIIFTYFLKLFEGEMEQELELFQEQLGKENIDYEVCKNIEDVEKRFILGLLKRMGIHADTSQSDKIEETGDALYEQINEFDRERDEKRRQLHKIIDGLPSQIGAIMSVPTEPIASKIVQIRDLYNNADQWASTTEYDTEKYCNILSDYGHFLYTYGFYCDAENVYQRYIPTAITIHGKNSSSIALAYSRLGAIYDCKKDYKNAIRYHKKSLSIRKKIHDRKIADSYICLGIINSESNRNLTAILLFRKALKLQKREYGKQSPLLAIVYNNLGWLYCIQDKYKKALEYLLKAMNLDDNSNERLVEYVNNNIGFAYTCIGQYTQALSFLNKAIDLREKKLGKKHPDTIESYIYIGYLYEKTGKDNRSISFFNKALKLSQYQMKPIHHNIRSSCNWTKLIASKPKLKYNVSYLEKNWR